MEEESHLPYLLNLINFFCGDHDRWEKGGFFDDCQSPKWAPEARRAGPEMRSAI